MCKHDKNVCCARCRPDVFRPTREQAVEYSTRKLTERILEAKRAYYSGAKTMTDQEYDALEKSLKAINPNAPVLQMVGHEVQDETKT